MPVVTENMKVTNSVPFLCFAAMALNVVWSQNDYRLAQSALEMQVISLLREFNVYHQIILSMKYTNQSKFMWSRTADLYYEPSPNISKYHKRLIQNHLTAVILDWRADVHYYNNQEEEFFSMQSYKSLSGFHRSFPKYMKNFLTLHFPKTVIPVGMLYSTNQVEHHKFLRTQIKQADFCVLAISYRIRYPIALSPEAFRKKLLEYLDKHETFPGKRNVTVLVDVNNWTVENGGKIWKPNSWGTLQNVMQALPYFNELAHGFMTQINETKYLQFFAKMAINITHSLDTDIILGGAPQIIDAVGTMSAQKANIVPFFKFGEDSDFNVVRRKLNDGNNKHANIALNLDSWGAVTRYRHHLERGSKQCSEQCRNESDMHARGADIILYFDQGISRVWSEIEHSVKRLLTNHQTIYGMTLKVLTFHEEDLGQNGGAIAAFLRTFLVAYPNLRIGCSLNFDSAVRRKWFQFVSAMETNASAIFKGEIAHICSPISDIVTVLIWKADDVYYSRLGSSYTAAYHDVFLTREVFMREFPGKRVIVETGYSDPENVVLSQIYGAPILLKANMY